MSKLYVWIVIYYWQVMPLIYLQATVLFNIGSIWSQIGAKQVRNKKQIP